MASDGRRLVMHFNLLMTNLWIALFNGDSPLPTNLRDLGYVPLWVDKEFAVGEGKRVNPDLIAFSMSGHHTLVLEWKSGANISPDQAERYGKVTSNDLRLKASVPTEASEEHQITYVGDEPHEERLSMGLDECAVTYPLIIRTEGGLELRKNSFAKQQLQELFEVGIPIDWALVPITYMPLDDESRLHEFASYVIQEVVSSTMRNDRVFTASDVSPKMIRYWRHIGTPMRNKIVAKVNKVLQLMGTQEFGEFYRWDAGSRNLMVTQNPWNMEPRRQTGAIGKIFRAGVNLVTMLERQESGDSSEGRQLPMDVD